VRRHLAESLAFCRSLAGWMREDELAWLWQEAALIPPGETWVEVGTWKGRSFAATVLGAAEGSCVVAVDTWLGSPNELGTTHREALAGGDGVFQAFLQVFRRLLGLRPDVDIGFVRTYSTAAACYWPRAKTVETVFIDGAHDTESVRKDFEAWLPLLKPGGRLIGHDREHPSVQAAIRTSGRFAGIATRPGLLWTGILHPEPAATAAGISSRCVKVASSPSPLAPG